MAALRERRRLGAMDHERLDIFREIDRAGIWLMFQPLNRLYGFYQRIEDVAGIVVHSGHPIALQRYTAAHEYGHHVLGHIRSLDGRDEIEGRPSEVEDPLAEIAAQAFAGAFLIPLHLLNQTAAALDINIEMPAPQDVYSLAVRFGVSYQAMRTQLRAYGLLDRVAFEQLDVSPLKIKEELGGGEPPTDHRADLWVVEHGVAPGRVALQVADEVIVRVPETASTGYRWRVGYFDHAVLDLIEDQSSGLLEGELGAASTRSLRFRALEPGASRLHLGLSRAFGSTKEIESVDVEVTVASPATGGASNGLFSDQHAQLAARRR